MIERADNEILVVSPSMYWLSNVGFTDKKIILHGLCNYLDKLQSLSVRPDGSLQGMSRKVQEELRQAARP